jgi:CelD/BcsL family acetyltransferase involved in cellulose biosynthesis
VNNPSPPILSVSLVDTEKAFRELGEAWNRLARGFDGSIFFQHEWFDAAWAWRKQDASLFVLLARQSDVLVGILPLVSVREKGRFPALRGLEFLAVPDTQACDLIAAPQDRSRVAEAFCAELHQRRQEWDRLELRYLDATGTTVSEFKTGLAARNYACEVKMQGPNLFVKLEPSWDAYYSTRSRSLKKANNLAANRLKKAGGITVQWITAENSGEPAIQDALEQAIDISRRSWKQKTGNSLDYPGPGDFIQTLTAHATRRKWFSLWLLFIDGKPLAMEYQLLDAGNVYALRADFDAECEEISPGSHLMRTLLESLFGRNLRRYYMGPGENPYKTRWTEEGDTLHQMVVYGRTWRGQLTQIVETVLKPLGRSLRDKLALRKAQPIIKDKRD